MDRQMTVDTKNRQIQLIRRRCADDQFNTVPNVADRTLIENLRTVVEPEKDVLEIGAGCSVYLKLFLDFGCRSLVANDLVEKRLQMVLGNDPRCMALQMHRILRPGGSLITFDPDYVCPLSIYRRFSDRTFNPSRLFSPFTYKKRALRQGSRLRSSCPWQRTTHGLRATGCSARPL